jgi:biopolymer transport protein ExbB/TolQ
MPVSASWVAAAAATKSAFPAVAVIVVLIVAVVVVMLLVLVANHWSLRRLPRRSWRLNRIRRAAAADVAAMRENDDLYDPDGPGQSEDIL